MARTPMWVIAVLGALLCGAPAWAQEEEVPPPSALMTPVPLTGTVLLPDGSPAANAEVVLDVWGKDRLTVLTDGNGRYSTELPDTDTYVVEARLRGVGMSKKLVAVGRDPQEAVTLDVQLHGVPEMIGTVYLPNGAVAANIELAQYQDAGREFRRPPLGGGPPGSEDLGAMYSGGGIPDPIRTDAQGRYRVPLLDPNDLSDNVSPCPGMTGDGLTYEGYVISPTGLGWAELQVMVDLDSPEVRRDIHLRPGARVNGTVIGYPGGAPMAGVRVDIGTDIAGPAMRRGPATVEQVVTDENGHFQGSAAIAPESLGVVARPPDGWAVMIEKWPQPDPTPGERHVDIDLLRDSVIEGQVFAPDGSPVADAQVVFGDGLEADTDADGRYRIEIRPGMTFYGAPPTRQRYLWVMPRLKDIGVAAPVRVDLTKEPLHYDFHLLAPATVTGTYVEEREGVPPADADVYLVPAIEGVEIGPPHPFPHAWDAEKSVQRNDETGEFRFEDVAPGEYWLEADGWKIRSVRAKDGAARRVTVPPGGTVTLDPLQLDYVPRLSVDLMRGPSDLDSYQVTGYIRPAGSSEPAHEMSVQAAGGGSYGVWARDCGPGRYEFVLVAAKEDSQYTTAIQTMDLTSTPPTERTSFDLGGAVIFGRVTLPDGVTGIPHIRLLAAARAGDAMHFAGTGVERAGVGTDENGNFAITGLLPGEYQITTFLPEEFYGPSPTARVRVRVNDRVGVVLRAEKVDW